MDLHLLDTIAITLRMQHGIVLNITQKRVKNINFRITVGQLNVSAPIYASDNDIVNAINKRMDWIINTHADIMARQSHINSRPEPTTPTRLILWGEKYDIELDEKQRLQIYRTELQAVMPRLFAKWQPIVGTYAHEQRIKKMKTRWGSCNTRAKRVWLSVYLAEYPIECTEYVIVHELCHLHHANHSPQFWAEVQRAMPEYQHWHDMLAGKHQHV